MTSILGQLTTIESCCHRFSSHPRTDINFRSCIGEILTALQSINAQFGTTIRHRWLNRQITVLHDELTQLKPEQPFPFFSKLQYWLIHVHRLSSSGSSEPKTPFTPISGTPFKARDGNLFPLAADIPGQEARLWDLLENLMRAQKAPTIAIIITRGQRSRLLNAQQVETLWNWAITHRYIEVLEALLGIFWIPKEQVSAAFTLADQNTQLDVLALPLATTYYPELSGEQQVILDAELSEDDPSPPSLMPPSLGDYWEQLFPPLETFLLNNNNFAADNEKASTNDKISLRLSLCFRLQTKYPALKLITDNPTTLLSLCRLDPQTTPTQTQAKLLQQLTRTFTSLSAASQPLHKRAPSPTASILGSEATLGPAQEVTFFLPAAAAATPSPKKSLLDQIKEFIAVQNWSDAKNRIERYVGGDYNSITLTAILDYFPQDAFTDPNHSLYELALFLPGLLD
jgi:hypothetical protein